jgi:hypothetical protein
MSTEANRASLPGGRGVPSVVGRFERPRGATCGGFPAANPLPYDTID